MHVLVVGLNHKTAELSLRESVALDASDMESALTDLIEDGLDEVAILSTCNRTEVYAVAGSSHEAMAAVHRFFTDRVTPSQRQSIADALYIHAGFDAASHLFSVAAGLDSLVVGEAQVMGQVKEARRRAAKERAVGPVLSNLFDQALRVGKRARTETGIGEGAASVSYAAVELAKKIFDDLTDKKILLVGAGKMAELAAKNLVGQGTPQVMVANRTHARAETLADRVGGQAVSFDAIPTLLEQVDIVIASTGSQTALLGVDDVQQAMARRKGIPLFLIDIAVPRDIDPAVHQLDGVFLYNVDDLQSVVESNLEQRRRHIEAARAIVFKEAGRFERWLRQRAATPVISALRQKVDETANQEVERVLRRLDHLPEREKEEVRSLARAIVGKLLHEPTVKLKASAEAGGELFTAAAELFDLELGPSLSQMRGRDQKRTSYPSAFPLQGAEEGSA